MHHHARTDTKALAVPDEMLDYYRPGNDRYWCSDYEGKQRLCAAVGIDFRYGDDHDQVVLELLRTLPHALRWVVEMRTGVWCGGGADDSWSNWRWIGKHVGTDANGCRHLYEAGVAMLRAEAAARHMPLGEPIGRSSRAMINTASSWQRIRFLVLQRDGYRCQLCGASAEEGARLEVDHKQAVARGGSNDEANLWTLCRDCNAGKGTDEL